jgi:hypothetical protein
MALSCNGDALFYGNDGRTLSDICSQILSQPCCYCFTLQKQKHQLCEAVESETGRHCDINVEEHNGGSCGGDGLRDYLITFICKVYLNNHPQRLMEF